jgi:hypothetical protein
MLQGLLRTRHVILSDALETSIIVSISLEPKFYVASYTKTASHIDAFHNVAGPLISLT